MSKININEVDNSIYNQNNLSENVVYVPGSAISGPTTPTLLGSYTQFISEFGSNGCESDDITFDYVAGILLSGFPVLFQRIQGNSTSAQGTLSVTNGDETIDFTVIFKYPGTLGNKFSLRIDDDGSSGSILRVIHDNNIKESFRLSTSSETLKDALKRLNSISTSGNTEITSKYIDITCATDLSTVELLEDASYVSTLIKLQDGIDITAEELENALCTPETFYTNDGTQNGILDKFLYNPKFITSGGHVGGTSDPMIANSINNTIIKIASTRKDCVALIDIAYGTDQATIHSEYANYNSSYATGFAPWQYVQTSVDPSTYKWMPASYVFLTTFADYVSKNSKGIYDIPAGISRMSVSTIKKSEFEIGEALYDSWQNHDYAVNPIMKLRNYGYVVFGQKTLMHVDSQLGIKSSLQELGVRLMINEVKRAIYDICLSLSFSNNVYHAWDEFKIRLKDKILDDLIIAERISSYEIKLEQSDDRSKVIGNVVLYVNNALEEFDLNVVINNSDDTVVLEEKYSSNLTN